MESQWYLILRHLEKGKTITPIKAQNKFKCFRLASRIHDLKHKGHIIENIGSSKYAEYRLVK